MRALDLWWIGRGGNLQSAMGSWKGGTGHTSGLDYPQSVVRHMERFWSSRQEFPEGNSYWWALADWAVDHGHNVDPWPPWRTTPERLFALGRGELIQYPPILRARKLYAGLLGQLVTWLQENPLPDPPQEF